MVVLVNLSPYQNANLSLCMIKARSTPLIRAWYPQTTSNVLIAMDAPLGWPQALGRDLYSLEAGKLIQADPNQLIRRSTDKLV